MQTSLLLVMCLVYGFWSGIVGALTCVDIVCCIDQSQNVLIVSSIYDVLQCAGRLKIPLVGGYEHTCRSACSADDVSYNKVLPCDH